MNDPYYKFQELYRGLPGQVYKGDKVTDAFRMTNATGGGKPHNNLQPYITKYLWERIS